MSLLLGRAQHHAGRGAVGGVGPGVEHRDALTLCPGSHQRDGDDCAPVVTELAEGHVDRELGAALLGG